MILKEAFDSGVIIDRELAIKTAKLVREHTACEQVKSTLDVYEINEDTIRKIREDNASDTEKVFNLLRSIGIRISQEIGARPYLQSIGEKAEQISKLYKQRQMDTQEALARIKILIDEINEAKQEQAQKNLPTELFTIYWILKDEKIERPEEKARSLSARALHKRTLYQSRIWLLFAKLIFLLARENLLRVFKSNRQ